MKRKKSSSAGRWIKIGIQIMVVKVASMLFSLLVGTLPFDDFYIAPEFYAENMRMAAL
ncbi:hypothetical protein [Marinibactrum halimedae]|uniref:Uncharacterized protein n=1 Tax=Marinibactrum halimedae TaxID=1444977 RepID=A0AA37WR26_9GAMM|nr:hypothetical protein [Marinibactrum halimedae]MCD9460215.1 hypothetical protein [Marinibactrum halimedae]GLS27952.1 hypothetical protein GCM10007877_36710 [Marinibactrum halimedae]